MQISQQLQTAGLCQNLKEAAVLAFGREPLGVAILRLRPEGDKGQVLRVDVHQDAAAALALADHQPVAATIKDRLASIQVPYLRHIQPIRQEVPDIGPDQAAELLHSLLAGKSLQPAACRVLDIDLFSALPAEEGVDRHPQGVRQAGQQGHVRRAAALPPAHRLGADAHGFA